MTRDQWDRERLREEAARLLRESAGEVSHLPGADVRDLVRELQQYQIELEEQNSELRRLQSELEESRDRYSDLYDFAPVGYLAVEPNNAIGAANLIAAELFQVSRDRLVGSFLTEHVDRRFQKELIDHLTFARESGENQSCDVRLHTEAAPVYVRLLIDIIARSDDQPPTLRIALSNVSEEKSHEFAAERRAQQQRLVEHQRSLGAIAGGFARDINQLLAPLMAQTAFIADALPVDSDLHAHLARIVAHTEVASDLCGSMLDLSDGAHRHHQIAIDDLLHTLPGWLAEELPDAQIDVSCHALGELTGSRSQLECAVRAVCQNGVEAVEQEQPCLSIDVIEATLREDDLHGLLAADAAEPGSYFEIRIADNGSGMTAEVAAQLLDPGYSTKGSDRGHGLAMVQQIITRHRGGMTVNSHPLRGTVVSLFLPIAQLPADGPSVYRSAEFIAGEGHLLLVEPDPTVRESTRVVLEDAGYQVDAPADTPAAVERFQQSWADIDAVLLDAQHSELQAVQTLLELRRCDPDVRVLMRTGRHRALSLDDLRQLGVSGVIRKPCSAFELTRKIRSSLQGTGFPD